LAAVFAVVDVIWKCERGVRRLLERLLAPAAVGPEDNADEGDEREHGRRTAEEGEQGHGHLTLFMARPMFCR
jgi:hypothetical protein